MKSQATGGDSQDDQILLIIRNHCQFMFMVNDVVWSICIVGVTFIRQWFLWLPHQKSKVVLWLTVYSRWNFFHSAVVQSWIMEKDSTQPYIEGDDNNSTVDEGSYIIKLAFNAPSQLIGDRGIPDHYCEMDNLMFLPSTSNVFCKA